MTADDNPQARVTERIAAVRARYVAGLPERVDELAALALKAGDPADPDAVAARAALRLGLHNVSGAAPTLGLQALGRKAAEVEARLVACPDGPLDAEMAAALAAEVRALTAVEG